MGKNDDTMAEDPSMTNEFAEQLKIMEDGYPLGAETCLQCKERAVVKMDGRLICLSCGSASPDHNGQGKTL